MCLKGTKSAATLPRPLLPSQAGVGQMVAGVRRAIQRGTAALQVPIEDGEEEDGRPPPPPPEVAAAGAATGLAEELDENGEDDDGGGSSAYEEAEQARRLSPAAKFKHESW